MTGTVPVVSIVTPSYNQAPFLEQTILSVLDQDYPNVEYIVIDGGSTDGSVNIIEKYAHRLAYWVSEPDRGQADALRKGFGRATGDILAWLNSDDFLLPGAVSTAVSAFLLSTSVGMVTGGCQLVTQDGKVAGTMAAQPVDLAGLLWANDIRQQSTFFLRSAYELAGGVDPAFHYSMDYELWLRLLTIAGMKTVPSVLAAFRLHASSKTVSQQDSFFWEDLLAVDKFLASPAGQAVPLAVRRRALTRRIVRCLEIASPDTPESLAMSSRLAAINPRPSVLEVTRSLAGTPPHGRRERGEATGAAAPQSLVGPPHQMVRDVARARYNSLAALTQAGVVAPVAGKLTDGFLRVVLLPLNWPIVQHILVARARVSRMLSASGAPTQPRLPGRNPASAEVQAARHAGPPASPTVVYVNPVGELGGAELTTLSEAPHHRKRGQRVVLVCPPHGTLAARAKRLGIPVAGLEFPGLLPAGNLLAKMRVVLTLVIATIRLRRILRLQRATVVCATSAKVAVLGGIAARLLSRRPCVISVNHDGFYFAPPFTDNLYFRVLRTAVLAVSDTVVVLTRSRLRQMRTFVRADRVELGRISLDLGPFYEANGAGLREELGLEVGDILIGMVGLLIESKGQREFLAAAGSVAARHSHARFIIVGDAAISGDTAYVDELHRQCRSLAIDDRVRFLGWRNDLPRIMASLDIFVSPSYDESFGRVVVEAMAAGAAVVATAVEGSKELVRHGHTGLLVPVRDHKTIAKALLYLIESPHARTDLGKEARAWTCQAFGEAPPEDLTMASICARMLERRDARSI